MSGWVIAVASFLAGLFVGAALLWWAIRSAENEAFRNFW